MKTIIIFLALIISSSEALSQSITSSDEEVIQLYKKAQRLIESKEIRATDAAYKKVIAYYKCHKRFDELPQNYMGIALVYALNGYYQKSIRYHKKALKAHRKYRPNEGCDEIEINLGLTYELDGRYRRAKKFFPG